MFEPERFFCILFRDGMLIASRRAHMETVKSGAKQKEEVSIVRTSKTAVVFAGQGRLNPECFVNCQRLYPYADDVFNEIDGGHEDRTGVSPAVPGDGIHRQPWGAIAQTNMPLFLFGASVSIYRYMIDQGVKPSALIGHGFGEIAALACSGALSVAQGAAVVRERDIILRRHTKHAGYMAALNGDSTAAMTLLRKVGSDGICIAVENSPGETVIAGRQRDMDGAASVARAAGMVFTRLSSAYPLHCPSLMSESAQMLVDRLRPLNMHPFATPVFSPYLGRYYYESDDILEMLASHLCRPLPFSHAVRHLVWNGIRNFISCGPLTGFDRHMAANVAGHEDCKILEVDATDASLKKLRALSDEVSSVDAKLRVVVHSTPSYTAACPSAAYGG